MRVPIQTLALPCGLKLLLGRQPGASVATADIWVGSGAADESDALSGVSHFLEHMLFKGAGKWGLGAIEREIEKSGGVCNAGTSYDFTHYYVTLPGQAIGTAIEALGAMVSDAALDDAELQKERGVILEEYRRKQDNPSALLFEKLYSEVCENGPYHLPVIGLEETIKGIERPGMLAYYQSHYRPENMTLVLTGAFDAAAAVKTAEQVFADFKRTQAGDAAHDGPMRMARGKRLHIGKKTGGEHYVAFALPAPGVGQRDKNLALDAAQMILGQGRAALLFQRLKEKRGLCSTISAYFPTHRFDTMFVAFATCEPARRDDLRKAVAEEFEAFAAAGPSEDQLRRTKRLLASAFLFSLETSGGLASNIGYYHTLTGSNDYLEQFMPGIEALQTEDVRMAFAELAGGTSFAKAMNEVSLGPEAAA